MPSTRTATVQDVEIAVEPETPPDPVYWTEDEPELVVTITNPEDADYHLKEDSRVKVRVMIDGNRAHLEQQYFGPIKKGDSKTLTVEVPPLTYEGHGVVEVWRARCSDRDSEWAKLSTVTGGKNHNPVYGFSVWDKSHYDATVRGPKFLQIASVVTSVALILFAAAQIVLALL